MIKFFRRGLRYLGRNAFELLLFNKACAFMIERYRTQPAGASILLYHRVCNRRSYPFLLHGGISTIAPQRFKRHLKWMKDAGFTFLTVRELAGILSAGQAPPERSVVITFDDIFRDNMETALDILTQLGVPATFFIITDNIDSNRLLWQHKLYWYLEEQSKRHFCDAMRRIDVDAFCELNYQAIIEKFMKYIPPMEKEGLLEQYGEPIHHESEIAASIYVTSEDLRKLRSLGMEIGSHSCGHYYMEMLPDEDYLKELVDSKEKLEAILGEPVYSFSYPHNSYKADEELIYRSGYRAICTVDSGRVVKGAPLHKLPRFNIPTYRSSLPALRRYLTVPIN